MGSATGGPTSVKASEWIKYLFRRRPLTDEERAARAAAEIERQQIREDRERIGDEQTGKAPPLER